MSVIVPIAAAIAGAFAAGLLAQFARRPRPILIVDELSRSPDVTPRRTGAVPNLDLAAACTENEFLPSSLSLASPDERVSEKDYVERLHAALDQTEISIEGLPGITGVARTLNDCLQRQDFATFRATFSRELTRLWPLLMLGNIQQRFRYDEEPPTSTKPRRAAASDQSIVVSSTSEPIVAAEDPPEGPSLTSFPGVHTRSTTDGQTTEYTCDRWQHAVVQEGEMYFIPLSGPANLLFSWNWVSAAQKLRSQSFSMRTAVAFASNYSQDLQQITNFLLTVEEQNRTRLETLRTQLAEELRQYERIVVKGFVANQGGSPVTVTNTARLFVKMEGYSFTDQDRTLRSFAKDPEIEMIIGGDREEADPAFDSAITVSGGSVARFAAASKERIQEMPDPEILLRAMTGGERECYLGTMTVSQGQSRFGKARSRSQLTPSYTEPQPFRDSASEVPVPPRAPGRVGEIANRILGQS